MTLYLIDINVWLAMTWDLHPQHAGAARWYATLSDSIQPRLLFCRMTMLGFLRLLTNRAVMGGSTLTVSDALRLYDRWIRDPRTELAPEPPRMEKLFRQALAPVSSEAATKAIADCYLIGFAAATGAGIVTLDRGLAGIAKRQKVPVVLIRPI